MLSDEILEEDDDGENPSTSDEKDDMNVITRRIGTCAFTTSDGFIVKLFR